MRWRNIAEWVRGMRVDAGGKETRRGERTQSECRSNNAPPWRCGWMRVDAGGRVRLTSQKITLPLPVLVAHWSSG